MSPTSLDYPVWADSEAYVAEVSVGASDGFPEPLRVSPPEHFVNVQQDPYGNWLSRHVFTEPITELK